MARKEEESNIYINFDDPVDMFPYNETQSFYSMNICGKPIFEHVIDSIRNYFPDIKISTFSKDILLNKLIIKYITRTKEININSSEVSKGISVLGNFIYVSKDKKIELTKPWHILRVMSSILSVHPKKIFEDTVLEETARFDGNISIGNKSEICSGAILSGDIYIGNNSLIGYNSLIRGPCVIEDNCRIGYNAEIKNSLIQRNTMIGPLSYVGDSVIGSSCSLGSLVRTSNFRLDRETVKVTIKEKIEDTNLNKLGAFIGNNVQVGVGVTILPGKIVGNDIHIYPKVIVEDNLQSGRIYFIEQKMRSIKFTHKLK